MNPDTKIVNLFMTNDKKALAANDMNVPDEFYSVSWREEETDMTCMKFRKTKYTEPGAGKYGFILRITDSELSDWDGNTALLAERCWAYVDQTPLVEECALYPYVRLPTMLEATNDL